jgi:hypothetical protein
LPTRWNCRVTPDRMGCCCRWLGRRLSVAPFDCCGRRRREPMEVEVSNNRFS